MEKELEKSWGKMSDAQTTNDTAREKKERKKKRKKEEEEGEKGSCFNTLKRIQLRKRKVRGFRNELRARDGLSETYNGDSFLS